MFLLSSVLSTVLDFLVHKASLDVIQSSHVLLPSHFPLHVSNSLSGPGCVTGPALSKGFSLLLASSARKPHASPPQRASVHKASPRHLLVSLPITPFPGARSWHNCLFNRCSLFSV